MSKTRVLGAFMTSHCSERNLCLAGGHWTLYCRNATRTPSCTLEYVARLSKPVRFWETAQAQKQNKHANNGNVFPRHIV